MTETTTKPSQQKFECRFAVYCPPPEHGEPDFHLVKEVVHEPDGTTRPNVRMLKNYKRPFWVTKRGAQNHKDKKEWEDIERLDRFESTQTELHAACCRALGTPWLQNDKRQDMRKLQSNPYLYGTDILSTAIIKRMYQDKFPELVTPFTISCFDTETDVIRGTNEIQMATVSFGKRVYTAVQKVFVAGQSDVVNRLHKLMDKYLSEYVAKRGIEWVVEIVDTEIDVVKRCFAKAHEWKPDFLAIWNIDFDMSKILQACERAKVYPEDIFSDPMVPRQYRHFKYKQGPKQKVTASGKVTPIKPSAQWHTVFCPSSFYFIDAMCAYRHIRTGNAEEPSYSLDAILQKHLGIRKLKFEEAEGLTGIDWHQFMQEKYPLEYVIYNVFDCVSMEELDEVTTDLRLTMPLFSGCSDFENFKSQPRRTADNLHYFALQNKRVIGSTSGEMAQEFDKETIGLDGWIVTLPAHLVVDNGLQVIEEAPDMRTNIRGHVGDLDVSASYPNGGCVFNISKETTSKELLRINGVTEEMRRMQGVNLSAGHTNAVEFCTGMYGLPSMETLLKSFQQQMNGEPDPGREAMKSQLLGMSQRMLDESRTHPTPQDEERAY